MQMPRSERLAAALALAALATVSCGTDDGPQPVAPLLVIGVDGFEWSVIHDLMEDGGMPNVRALMERGSFGELQTIEPTLSPIIWNTISTGRTGRDHGILGFLDVSTPDDPSTPEKDQDVYTSTQRKVRAVWNIADEYGLTSQVVGWWTTWPVDEVNGVMVSGMNSGSMADVNWKPTLDSSASDQVWPPEREDDLLLLAETVGAPDVVGPQAEHVFGALKSEHFGIVEEEVLIEETLWSVQSDMTFSEIMKDLLADRVADLNMVYLGGPDVSGHRFWRYYQPEPFQWPGNPEIDAWARSKIGAIGDDRTLADVLADEEGDAILAGVIPRYYAWVDDMIGDLVATAGEGTTILIVSDHGMRATSTDRPNAQWITGHHIQARDPRTGRPVGPPAPNGTILAAGPGIQAQSGVGVEQFLRVGPQALPTHGSVMNVAPTILALLGIPRSRAMESAYTPFMTSEAREKAELKVIPTHDEGFRAPYRVEAADMGESLKSRMEELGYMDPDVVGEENVDGLAGDPGDGDG